MADEAAAQALVEAARQLLANHLKPYFRPEEAAIAWRELESALLKFDGGGPATHLSTGRNVSSDPVDHPAHYNQGRFETIEVIYDMDPAMCHAFCIANAFKYIHRAPHKGAELEDLKKARWYLDYAIGKLEGRSDG